MTFWRVTLNIPTRGEWNGERSFELVTTFEGKNWLDVAERAVAWTGIVDVTVIRVERVETE